MSSRARTNSPASNKKAGEAQNFASLFSEIAAEWDRAEEVIKLAEQVILDVVFPAIKELRYAGRRLVDALNCEANGGSPPEVTAYLEDAKFSCHRARHDAIDAALSFMAIELDRLAKQMGYDVVQNSYPEFVNFVERLDEARAAIAESRRNRHDRDKIYTAISKNNFPELVEDFKALRRSRTTMEIIVGRKKLGIWTGIFFGALIAIPGYFMSWYFWKHPVPIEQPAQEIAPSPPAPNPALSTAPTANVINPPPKLANAVSNSN